MGVPAISSAYDGASDAIVPEEGPARGEVIADPADATALADAMARFTDPDHRRRCREACAGLDQALHIDRHIEALIPVLRAAAGSPPPPAAEA
jgi:UDP-glucose:(heptosyl)LPS alpha-1,3-glucosyltransferase